LLNVLGEESIYYGFMIHGLRLIKNFTPLRASPVRKIIWALESKFVALRSTTKSRL
jgi:hypothetical protein